MGIIIVSLAMDDIVYSDHKRIVSLSWLVRVSAWGRRGIPTGDDVYLFLSRLGAWWTVRCCTPWSTSTTTRSRDVAGSTRDKMSCEALLKPAIYYRSSRRLPLNTILCVSTNRMYGFRRHTCHIDGSMCNVLYGSNTSEMKLYELMLCTVWITLHNLSRVAWCDSAN